MDRTKAKQPFKIPHEGDELVRAARREIDDNIDELERTVRYLKMKRNELSPVSVLPNEVLSKIFILVRDLPIDLWVDNLQTSWIRVGQVCHRWREVALGCSSLWSVPVFTNPDLSQEMMRRSKMTALTIRSDAMVWAPKMYEQLENAMAQIHRIRSIELSLRNVPNPQAIISSLSKPAPLLEEISLWGVSPSTNDHQPSFPLDALSDAPCLRSIDFNYLSFSWESAVFKHKNLTDVRLGNNDATSTFGQMMDALCQLPNLRALMLMDSIPSHATSNRNEKILEFTSLEQLELRAKAADCIFLLQHIQYPAHVTVRIYSYSTGVEDSFTIFSLIGQNLRHIGGAGGGRSPVTIRSAELVSDDLRDPEIEFFDKVDETEHVPFGAFNPIITIYLRGDLTLGQAHSRLLMSLCNCFDLSSLQELLLHWIFDSTGDDTDAIQNSIGKLPNLEIINMSAVSLPQVCDAIAGSSEDSSAPEQTQTLDPSGGRPQQSFPPVTVFPALRTLIVESVDFRYFPENMEHLIDMLMKRSDMNAPIDTLSIEQCRGVGNRQKRQLGELVVDLEVEGEVIDVRELDFDSSDEDED